MKSTSSVLVHNLGLNYSCSGLIDAEVVLKGRHGRKRLLCQPSMFTTTFTGRLGLSFFFPLGGLWLFNRKHESDQKPEQT